MNEFNSYTSQDIYRILKEEILTLKILPGNKISENDICERFGVSRTPVRSAFQRLDTEGLITVAPYKSTFAALLDFEQIEQMIYMRYAIETAVLKDFIEVVDPMTIEKIRYRIRQQEVLISGDFTPDQFYVLDSKMHNIWFAFMHKDGLWEFIQRAQVDYTRFRMLDIVAVKNFKQIITEHHELFDAICKKDAFAAEALIKRHLYGGVSRLGERIYTEFTDYFISK